MSHPDKVFCIIPARAGSKGLPRKNLTMVLGKPLIQWTIEQSLNSNNVDKVFVSTDSDEIAELARSLGAIVPFMRPSELARDDTSSVDVLEHFIRTLTKEDINENNFVLLAEPTSPIRQDFDMDEMINLLEGRKEEFDSVISMGLAKESPSLMHTVEDNMIEPLLIQDDYHIRRQDFPKFFYPYGGLYLSKISSLLKKHTFYTDKCLTYIMEDYQCYEIDDEIGLRCVESIMKWKGYS